jgi:hypothetical protein
MTFAYHIYSNCRWNNFSLVGWKSSSHQNSLRFRRPFVGQLYVNLFAICASFVNQHDRIRVCLTGLLLDFGSGSCRGALPNVSLEEPFFSKKQRSRSCFGWVTNCGSSKMALASVEEPLKRSCVKYPLTLLRYRKLELPWMLGMSLRARIKPPRNI